MEIRPVKIFGVSLLLAGLALCGVGLWLLLSPAQYQATAVIMVEPDVGDIDAIGGPPRAFPAYDPYFIQTTFEIIQSEVVLGKVVETLNLNVEWGEKYSGGKPLKTLESLAILRNHLRLALIRNTRLFSISAISENPDEAARIANAIAKAYQDYRLETRRQMTLKGIEVWQQDYQEEEKKIQIQQTNVDLLREKYKINKDDEAGFGLVPGPTGLKPNEVVEQQKEFEGTKPFWEEKRKLENMLDFHKLLQAKIAEEKLSVQIPKTTIVQIVDAAQPPKSPASPNRFLGAVLLAIGLFPTVGGFLIIKSARRPSA